MVKLHDPQARLSALNRIFRPDSVAVIGASSTPGKIGYAIVENLKNGGYKGHIYPVNPKAEEILGLPCYKSLLDIEGDIDVVLVAIPAAFVAKIVPDAGAKNVAGLIVISSGFAEIGEHELQRELTEAAEAHNVRVMGPNIYGYYYTPMNLCATFCTPYNEKGGVALVSQSGGVGMAILGFSRSRGMGVSAIVGLGNKSDIDEDDLLEFFGEDPNTKVIAIHMEDIKDGKGFMETATRVSKKKPIVILKAGRTAQGARAAASHTGALAGVDEIYDAAFRQSGVIRANTLEELLDWAWSLQTRPDTKGENAIIITGAGGMGKKYLRYSKLMHERQGISVYYNGLRCWLEETQDNLGIRSTAVFINLRGSIEQCFADYMVGVPHDEHHKAIDLNWRCTGETHDVFARMFRVFFLLLRPRGRVVIHANGTGAAISREWYDETIQKAAKDAGLTLHMRENYRLHSWVKDLT